MKEKLYLVSSKIKLWSLERILHSTCHCIWLSCIRKISSAFVSSGTDIKKQRIVKVAAFLVVVVTGIWITNKHFSSVHIPKIWINKTCNVLIRTIVNHYFTNRNIKIFFEMINKSHLVWLDLINFSFRHKFPKFFSLIDIWGSLTHSFITNLLCIYDYVLNSSVNHCHFSQFNFLNNFILFSLHIREIIPITHNFWEINIV